MAHAQKLAAFIGLGPGKISASSYGLRSNVHHTLQPQHKRAHQQRKGQKARHRVAGQAHEVGGTTVTRDLAIGKRLAGLHGDLPQVERAQRLDGGLDVVFLAHTHAAAGQDQVVCAAGLAQGVDGGVAPVGHDAKVRHLAAQAQQHGAQEEAVAVVNGTRAHLLRRHLAGHDQFIARGEQRHAGATGHLQFVQADAGGQAQLGRGQACTGRQHHGTPGDVLARAADPLALWGHGVDAHLAQAVARGEGFAIFLHQDGIRPLGHWRAGEDAGGTAWREQITSTARGNAL
ncbi:hypothetical protein D3C71_1366650 [compost metagenome]